MIISHRDYMANTTCPNRMAQDSYTNHVGHNLFRHVIIDLGYVDKGMVLRHLWLDGFVQYGKALFGLPMDLIPIKIGHVIG